MTTTNWPKTTPNQFIKSNTKRATLEDTKSDFLNPSRATELCLCLHLRSTDSPSSPGPFFAELSAVQLGLWYHGHSCDTESEVNIISDPLDYREKQSCYQEKPMVGGPEPVSNKCLTTCGTQNSPGNLFIILNNMGNE